MILRGHWCNIIVLNVHAPCEDKNDDVKDSFYEELGYVFDQFWSTPPCTAGTGILWLRVIGSQE
jgi:hypothetical protein